MAASESKSASIVSGVNDQPKVVVTHSSGSSIEVYIYGATLTSFKDPHGYQRLFTASKAVYNGKKAIRGGVPLVFPQFGPGDLPNHGFARISNWNVASVSDGKVVFTLSPSEDTRKVWDHGFEATYTIEFNATSLTTSLSISNTDAEPWKFQALLHTYFALESISKLRVQGLKDTEYSDKVAKKVDTEASSDVAIAGEVDRVYKSPYDQIVLTGLQSGGPNAVATLVKSATVGGEKVRADAVLWNAWVDKAKALSDMGDEDYLEYVCVEPGLVSKFHDLPAGKDFSLTQTITWSDK